MPNENEREVLIAAAGVPLDDAIGLLLEEGRNGAYTSHSDVTLNEAGLAEIKTSVNGGPTQLMMMNHSHSSPEFTDDKLMMHDKIILMDDKNQRIAVQTIDASIEMAKDLIVNVKTIDERANGKTIIIDATCRNPNQGQLECESTVKDKQGNLIGQLWSSSATSKDRLSGKATAIVRDKNGSDLGIVISAFTGDGTGSKVDVKVR